MSRERGWSKHGEGSGWSNREDFNADMCGASAGFYLSWRLFLQPTGRFEGDQEEIGNCKNKIHSNLVLIEDEVPLY